MTTIDREALEKAIMQSTVEAARYAGWGAQATAVVRASALDVLVEVARDTLAKMPTHKTVWRVEWTETVRGREEFADKDEAVWRQAELISHHDYRDVHVTGPHTVPVK